MVIRIEIRTKIISFLKNLIPIKVNITINLLIIKPSSERKLIWLYKTLKEFLIKQECSNEKLNHLTSHFKIDRFLRWWNLRNSPHSHIRLKNNLNISTVVKYRENTITNHQCWAKKIFVKKSKCSAVGIYLSKKIFYLYKT